MSEQSKKMPAIYTRKELTKAENIVLNDGQINLLLKKTPDHHIKKRPGPSGKTLSYVSGSYVKKVLNFMFGWDWSFEVVKHEFDMNLKQVYVLGKLIVPIGDRTITKMQFGTTEVKFKRGTNDPVNLGNDLKSATTDALKKCASELGLFSDVYSPDDYNEVQVIETPDDPLAELNELFEKHGEKLTTEDYTYIEMIIDTKDETSYMKAIKTLKYVADNHKPKSK